MKYYLHSFIQLTNNQEEIQYKKPTTYDKKGLKARKYLDPKKLANERKYIIKSNC